MEQTEGADGYTSSFLVYRINHPGINDVAVDHKPAN